jgi:simple sugar transport system ATP-binding protein
MLEVDGVGVQTDGRWVLQGVTFTIHSGEIVGIAGVEGNGQRELVETIIGVRPAEEGSIRMAGQDVVTWDTRGRRERGIGYIPEDRQGRGLLMPEPLWENTMLGHQGSEPFASGFWINIGGARRRTEEVISEYHVATPGPDVPAFALSGGNQQKLIVGRELTAEPKVLIAAQPTRGVDVGAQAAVWEQIRRARAAGLALLLISADLEELIGLSDTLYVIFGGRLVAKVDPKTVTPEELGSYMTGAKEEEATA